MWSSPASSILIIESSSDHVIMHTIFSFPMAGFWRNPNSMGLNFLGPSHLSWKLLFHSCWFESKEDHYVSEALNELIYASMYQIGLLQVKGRAHHFWSKCKSRFDPSREKNPVTCSWEKHLDGFHLTLCVLPCRGKKTSNRNRLLHFWYDTWVYALPRSSMNVERTDKQLLAEVSQSWLSSLLSTSYMIRGSQQLLVSVRISTWAMHWDWLILSAI